MTLGEAAECFDVPVVVGDAVAWVSAEFFVAQPGLVEGARGFRPYCFIRSKTAQVEKHLRASTDLAPDASAPGE